jgi:hypothetical protein
MQFWEPIAKDLSVKFPSLAGITAKQVRDKWNAVNKEFKERKVLKNTSGWGPVGDPSGKKFKIFPFENVMFKILYFT